MSTYHIDHYNSPAAFYGVVGAFLMEHEVENNVIIGLTLNAIKTGRNDYHMWRVHDGVHVLGAALMTPERPLNLAIPAAHIAVPLAARLVEDGVLLSGIRGEIEASKTFRDTWCAKCGQSAHLHMPQLLYRLDSVIPTTGVSGYMRKAYAVERSLLITWMDGFEEDAFGTSRPGESERAIDSMLEAPDGRGVWVWEDEGRAVSMAAVSRLTPHGAVVSFVYTPRDQRRRGYAGALTGALSAHLLASGRKWCALYTDRNNPTSNKIYQQIGYRRIGEEEHWVFES